LLLQSAPAKFFDDAVMGDTQTDKRVGLRHNAGILGWTLGQVNETRDTTVSS
jgi:hypothetical protein